MKFKYIVDFRISVKGSPTIIEYIWAYRNFIWTKNIGETGKKITESKITVVKWNL